MCMADKFPESLPGFQPEGVDQRHAPWGERRPPAGVPQQASDLSRSSAVQCGKCFTARKGSIARMSPGPAAPGMAPTGTRGLDDRRPAIGEVSLGRARTVRDEPHGREGAGQLRVWDVLPRGELEDPL
jgi:hypothetical protein